MKASISRSFSPYSTLNPISSDGSTRSASLAQAEREIQTLQEENVALKKEIAEIGSAYKQLITENKHENYDERRVDFLKAQMIQLERQLLVLTEALSSRATVLLDVENSLSAIAESCRSYRKKEGRIGEVTVSRDDLQRMEETAESSRIKLYKTIENTTSEDLRKPVQMLDTFLKSSVSNPPTILDICSGRLEHLNLKHVAKLESQLAQLYRQLIQVNTSLQSVLPSSIAEGSHMTAYKSKRTKAAKSNQTEATDNLYVSKQEISANQHVSRQEISANQHVSRAVYVRLGTQVARACNTLKDVTQDLLSLSVLVPSAPWPLLKRPFMKELTTDVVLSNVTGLSRAKMAELRKLIDSLLKAMNYTCNMNSSETRVLKEELKFHQEVYQLQMQYMDNLFQALKTSYLEFQASTNELICDPLKDVLSAYETLKITASENALKNFLNLVKEKAEKMSSAVEILSADLHSEEGTAAISTHGEDFFRSLQNLQAQKQLERDSMLQDLETVKEQHRLYSEEIQRMFPPDTETITDESKVNHTSGDSPRDPTSVIGEQSRDHRNKGKPQPQKRTKTIEILDDSTRTDCSCGVEADITRVSWDDSGTKSRLESDHDKDNSRKTGSVSETKRTPTVNRRRNPQKPVVGIPQAQLVLKPKSTTKKPMSKEDIEFSSSVEWDGEITRITSAKRSGSSSDVADSKDYYHGDDDVSPSARSERSRSGSLSRVGYKPHILEPLMPATASRIESQNRPWK